MSTLLIVVASVVLVFSIIGATKMMEASSSIDHEWEKVYRQYKERKNKE